MCRQFRRVQARLILEKQDEMREIEEEIDSFDRADFMKPDKADRDPLLPWRLTRRRRQDPEEAKKRRELFERAEKKFKEYSDLVSAAQRLACFEKPAKYEHESVSDVVWQTLQVTASEMEWMLPENRHDLISLRGASEHATVGAVIEKTINKIKGSESFQRWNPQNMQQWLKANRVTEKLAGWCVNTFLVMLVPIMFVLPIYALSRIGNNIGKSIGVLLSFALVFTFFLTIGTPAKPHEILSGSAA